VGKDGCLTEDRIDSLYRARKEESYRNLLPSMTYLFFRLLREKPLSQCGVFIGEVEEGTFLRNVVVLLHDYTAS